MDGSPLEATVEVIPGGALVLLAGRIDRAAAASLNAAYATASAAGSVVTLDFAATDYINSTGIALIVGVLAEARRDGRQIVARGLTDHYREIFRITRLSDFMTIEEDQAATPGGRTERERDA